jgi:4-diphosphocytidyl-2-C-methyl-D-erythritol kinase
LVIFSNCKINIGLRITGKRLRITGKRVDGYHDLENIFYPLGLKDAIEIMEAPAGDEEFRLIST